MKIKVFIISILLLCFAAGKADAQMFSVSTNTVDWLNFGTINAEGGMSVSQHFSLLAGGHYNPWEIKINGFRVHNQQATGYVGARYWPWYVFSGWWLGTKVQYSFSSKTGIWRPAMEDAHSIGAGFSFGYTVMLNEHLNLEFGAGIWGGKHLKYTIYECPECMRVRISDTRNFIYPDDLSISIMYVF